MVAAETVAPGGMGNARRADYIGHTALPGVSTQLGGSDHGSIVADEIVAFPLVVMGVSAARKPWVMALAFVIYRFFDALKPPPIHLAELAGGGLGIVLDDVLAAAVSFIVLALLLKWLPATWFRASSR
nr:phosphatidylglycerophosphatase A [Halomonas azerica]